MEASVTNCFSPGDRVIVCSAGKFGERWVELTQAFGLDAVDPQRALRIGRGTRHAAESPGRESRREGRLCPGVGKLHRSGPQCPRHGRNREEHAGAVHCRRHHGRRHHAARYRRLGSGFRHQRIAKSLHAAARAGVPLHQPQGLGAHGIGQAAALLFRSAARKEKCRQRRIGLDARDLFDPWAWPKS